MSLAKWHFFPAFWRASFSVSNSQSHWWIKQHMTWWCTKSANEIETKYCVKMKEQFLPQLEYLRRSSDYSGKHFKVIGALRGSLSTDNCQTHSPTGDRSTILCLLLITKFSSNKITGKDVGILSVNGTGILGEISGVSQTSRTYDPPMTCSGAITLSYRRLEGA